MISIIVRAKNEERWIPICFDAISRQKRQDFEIILVDNLSSDRTVEIALEYKVKVISIEDYLPGKAINLGIDHSVGEIIVCISAHCVPVNENWLDNLVADTSDSSVAGVYGRQQPMSFSSDKDKRDLLTVFGLDKKVQRKDSFFHNANSAFRRDVWEDIKFDENTKNVEDRIWGVEVVKRGYTIVYEPDASVYHFHGIHHDHVSARRENVVRVLESLNLVEPQPQVKALSPLEITALIPVKGELIQTNNSVLLDYTIARAKECEHLTRVVVLPDNADVQEYALSKGVDAPFIRPDTLSLEHIGIPEVLSFAVDKLREDDQVPDICVVLEQTYPFRSVDLIKTLIERFMSTPGNALLPVNLENRATWIDRNGGLEPWSEMMPRKLKDDQLLVGLFGLGFVTYPRFLTDLSLGFENLQLCEIDYAPSAIEIRDSIAFASMEHLLRVYWNDTN